MLELETAVGEPLTMLVATKQRDLSTDQDSRWAIYCEITTPVHDPGEARSVEVIGIIDSQCWPICSSRRRIDEIIRSNRALGTGRRGGSPSNFQVSQAWPDHKTANRNQVGRAMRSLDSEGNNTTLKGCSAVVVITSAK